MKQCYDSLLKTSGEQFIPISVFDAVTCSVFSCGWYSHDWLLSSLFPTQQHCVTPMAIKPTHKSLRYKSITTYFQFQADSIYGGCRGLCHHGQACCRDRIQGQFNFTVTRNVTLSKKIRHWGSASMPMMWKQHNKIQIKNVGMTLVRQHPWKNKVNDTLMAHAPRYSEMLFAYSRLRLGSTQVPGAEKNTKCFRFEGNWQNGLWSWMLTVSLST